MTTVQATFDPASRQVPPLGGFNLTVLGIELKRMLRNRRTIIFTLVLPAALLLSFGGQKGWQEQAGSGNVAAYILVSMGLYGAARRGVRWRAVVTLFTSWARAAARCSATSTANGAPTAMPTTPTSMPSRVVTHMSVW